MKIGVGVRLHNNCTVGEVIACKLRVFSALWNRAGVVGREERVGGRLFWISGFGVYRSLGIPMESVMRELR